MKTIKITYTEQAFIRCTARVDMPEYGIKAGEIFYCSRSSKNDGTYYITRYDVVRNAWTCSCPATKPCRHIKAVNADCQAYAAAEAAKRIERLAIWRKEQEVAKNTQVARPATREIASRLAACGLMRK